MAKKVWVLDTETKGTGANMVPLENTLVQPEPTPEPARPRRPRAAADASSPVAARPRPPSRERRRVATALPPGHVRKKATGEIGRVQRVDPRAGTATVLWLKQGRTSTVPLTAISRR